MRWRTVETVGRVGNVTVLGLEVYVSERDRWMRGREPAASMGTRPRVFFCRWFNLYALVMLAIVPYEVGRCSTQPSSDLAGTTFSLMFRYPLVVTQSAINHHPLTHTHTHTPLPDRFEATLIRGACYSTTDGTLAQCNLIPFYRRPRPLAFHRHTRP